MTIKSGYVRVIETGEYYVQAPDDNQWGFTLYSDNQSWEGGFGIAGHWVSVPASQVPDDVKTLLGNPSDYDVVSE